MKRRIIPCLLTLVCLGSAAGLASAHDGRRFDIEVYDNQLIAQGYNSGNDDGEDPVRPYVNSLHDHFSFIGDASNPIGFANLPSWDIGILPDSDVLDLIGSGLELTLVSSGKWINVPPQDGTGVNQDFGVPELMTFSASDLTEHPEDMIQIGFGLQAVDTLNGGTIQLAASVTGNETDLDFEYFIANHNTAEIYFIEWQMSSGSTEVQNSNSIYTLLSPDGANAVEKLHFQSLYLEAYLGAVLDSPLPGDVNQDGTVNLLDVAPFVQLLTSGEYLEEADINGDGAVNLLDVQGFVDLLTD